MFYLFGKKKEKKEKKGKKEEKGIGQMLAQKEKGTLVMMNELISVLTNFSSAVVSYRMDAMVVLGKEALLEFC